MVNGWQFFYVNLKRNFIDKTKLTFAKEKRSRTV